MCTFLNRYFSQNNMEVRFMFFRIRPQMPDRPDIYDLIFGEDNTVENSEN